MLFFPEEGAIMASRLASLACYFALVIEVVREC
jgi:hypothetical protein